MNNNTVNQKPARQSWFSAVASRIVRSVHDLFRPEEVEVTFKKEGDRVTYTYTRVQDKRVA
jgi:hypothetical protein